MAEPAAGDGALQLATKLAELKVAQADEVEKTEEEIPPFECEHYCGFMGSFEDVSEHEGGCKMRDGSGGKLWSPELKTLAETVASMLVDPRGDNSDDYPYPNPAMMWEKELQHPRFYEHGAEYWDDAKICPTTDDGVLGGYGHVSPTDITGSKHFLQTLSEKRPSLRFREGARAADIGAGIGRVTRHLLLDSSNVVSRINSKKTPSDTDGLKANYDCWFGEVELVEKSKRLIEYAPTYIGPLLRPRVKAFHNVGMEDFLLKAGDQSGEGEKEQTYDMIWIQWTLGHLVDTHFIAFMRRMQNALRSGGVICAKENCCSDLAFSMDKEDCALTRSKEYYEALFKLAGLQIVLCQEQAPLEDDLFPVYMWALE